MFYKSEQISPEWRGSAAEAVPVQGVGECYASPEGNRISLRELRNVVYSRSALRAADLLEEDPPIGPSSGYLE